MELIRIRPNEVHLWYQDLSHLDYSTRFSHYLNILSEDERSKLESFSFAPKRHEYLTSRVLVRTTLSKYCNLSPGKWTFSTNGYGHPTISNGDTRIPINFNISHTEGLLVCAIGLDCELGVDVEKIKPSSDLIDIAKSHFSSSEFNALKTISKKEKQNEEFFKYWTLKEAYIKGRGMGLSIPIKKFGFDIKNLEKIKLETSPIIDSNPNGWLFKFLKNNEYPLAVAIRKNGLLNFNLVERNADIFEKYSNEQKIAG